MLRDDDFPPTITIGDREYDVDKMNDAALAQLRGIQFCDRQIQQLNNEWAIADTARLGYLHALQSETLSAKTDGSDG